MDIFNNFPSSFKCLGGLSQVFDFEFMMGLARECGLVVRRRKIQPLLVLKAFLDEGDGKRSVSMSAVWRRYRLLAGIAGLPLVSGTAFFNFVAKGALAKFLEEFGIELGKRLGDSAFTDTADAVAALAERLGGLRDILAQDGTVAAVNPQAAARAPESFKNNDGEGGLKMHAAWSLSKSTLESSSITSAVSSERDEIRMDRVKGSLIICDAGYPSIELFGKLQDQGALMLFKMRSSMKPSVLKCSAFSNGKYSEELDFGGERVKLRDDPRLGGQSSYDCVVSFARKGRAPLVMRVVKVFNPRYCGTHSSRALAGHGELTPLDGHCFLATNIPASQLDADQLYALYRLRWNAERQFMALKSGCSFSAGKAIKETSIRNLIRMSTAAHHLKCAMAGAFSSMLGGARLSLLKVATGSGVLVNCMIDRVLGAPGIADGLGLAQFKELMLDAYGLLSASSPSAVNRRLGKSVGCTVQALLRPPSPGGPELA